ncbi:hypothetical protein B2J93_5141 [Marssonina coronariae]|uniref:DUF1750-domain-containing protein n=1 Tax=Diplocarpon coronariae TaxID=2795749 RepID=A0A218ZFX9_9HELO|nr:hypothetical protein B2J93_5141 [Marssonina coronariae]
MNMQMQDPSQGIQRELQGHVHLLSTFRFPSLAHLHPDKVAEYLIGAPKIARDQAPFYWTYLDRPADGSVLLVWQSSSLGQDFPSDGYIWTPTESPFAIEVAGGYTLEMYQQKTGFAPNEPVATHSRRRYRLLPPRTASSNPAPDPSLWIIHYTQCDPHDRVPSNVIPVDMRMQQIMSTRSYLQSHGQIVQKEFMLHDRNNWPSIGFPRGPPRGGPPMYGANAPPARMPQTMAYPVQQHPAGPPAKRARTQPSTNQAVASTAAPLEVDDEEDFTRGDFFDLMTPRDVSMARYKQNHEWMEEVLSSPYAIHQIIPTDLGLGMRGQLGSLTEGVFDAPYNPLRPYDPKQQDMLADKDPAKQVKGVFFTPYHSEDKDAPKEDVPKNVYVGRLDPEKAEEFRKRVNEQILEINAEIEKMKAKHAKRMAKFRKGSLISNAEKELRTAVDQPAETGPEVWRLEGRIEEDEEEEEEKKTKAAIKAPPKVSDIVAQVEASVGRHAAAVKELIRIQDGGYEEAPTIISPQALAVPTPHAATPASQYGSAHASQTGSNGSQHSGVLVGDADVNMSNSAAGLLDQYHPGGHSSNVTPGPNSNLPTPQPLPQNHSSANTPSNLHTTSAHPPPPAPPPAQEQLLSKVPSDSAGGDWVVVPPGGVSPHHASLPPQTQVQGQPTAETTHTHLPEYHASPNDFADLADLEGAAGYAGGGGDLGELGLDMDVDADAGVGMEDSAFGEAFHGVETREEEGEGI